MKTADPKVDHVVVLQAPRSYWREKLGLVGGPAAPMGMEMRVQKTHQSGMTIALRHCVLEVLYLQRQASLPGLEYGDRCSGLHGGRGRNLYQ